jgi:PAS domain S-box-containing protein
METKTQNETRNRVLIVEDEALITEEIQGRLQHLGHQVVGIVDNGLKAIEMAKQTRPDLVLMDIRIKGQMDGIETASRIYQELQIPIVYLTAHADQATLERAKATAQFGYVVKPFQERELMMAVDIAVRRHGMEKSLQKSHLTYATILDSVTDAVIATDEQSRARFLNPVAEQLTGWSIEAANGVPAEQVLKFVDPATGAELSEPLEQVLRGEIIAASDKVRRLINRNGDWATVEVSKSPIKDAGGTPVGAVVVLRNVTEHRRAEERFRNLMESAPDAMVIVNAGGKILLVNSQTEKMFGYPRGELIGNVMEMLIPENLRGKHRTYRDRYCQDPQARAKGASMELLGRRKDGTEFPIEMSLSPLETEEGLVISSAIRDITERKRTEAELRQAHKMEAIGTLAGGIAHDFNNILAAIMGYAELARSDIDHPRNVEASLDEIARAGNRATNLVRQILTFTRQEPLRRVVLSVVPIVEECVSLLRATIPAGVDLQLVIKSDVPELFADASQIHQVLMNLCTNAWHAVPENGGRIVISLEPVEVTSEAAGRVAGLGRGKYARLSVQDNGHGMDEATRTKVFEPFFTTKEPGKGTGLGLSVVLGIVLSHNGIIDLHSELAGGTTMHVYFPAASSEKGVQQNKDVQPKTKTLFPHGHGERILFIDDEQPLVRMATPTIQRLGYRIDAFNQADLALKAFTAAPDEFAVVITDLNMPGISGLDVAREILKLRPGVSVILNSGYVSEELMSRARELGVARILLKPNSMEDLATALYEVCRRSAKPGQTHLNH